MTIEERVENLEKTVETLLTIVKELSLALRTEIKRAAYGNKKGQEADTD